MTTSGADTWNPYLEQIVRQALINATAIAEDENPTGEQYLDGLYQLNGLVKAIEATGAHVWTEEEGTLFLSPNTRHYTLASTGSANTSDAYSWEQTTTSAAAAAAATAIVVTSATGLAVSQNIGIVLNDNTTQWTTISSLAGTTVNLADALTDGVDAGNVVLAYTTKLSRPLKVPKARLLTLSSGNEIPMTRLSRQEYMDLPNKGANGVPTQFFYSPRRDTGLFYVWPVPAFSQWAINYTWYRPLQDFLTPEDTSDFPQEWVLPLQWALTKQLAPSYGVPQETWARIVEMETQYSTLAVNYDREPEDVQFGMDYPDGGR